MEEALSYYLVKTEHHGAGNNGERGKKRTFKTKKSDVVRKVALRLVQQSPLSLLHVYGTNTHSIPKPA